MRGSFEERLLAKISKTPDCWEWTAGKNANGYGRIFALKDGKRNVVLAHRATYEMFVGEIPAGLAIDHICHNRGCVRPDHLRPVTAKENLENLAGPFSTSKSGIRGVSWSTQKQQWRAVVTHNRRHVSAGNFASIEEAKAAVIAKRLELFTHNDADKKAA